MNDFSSGLPWEFFREFIAPDANRFAVLKKVIDGVKLGYRILTVDGNRHFIITAPKAENELRRRTTILAAHYDRASGSPGANDNSAAVFILIETALKLTEEKTGSWMVIFTDREELEGGDTLQDQGSYSLAAGLRDTGLENSRVYNFDACGTGDTLIISTTAEKLLKNENSGMIRASIKELQEYALAAARNLGMMKVLLLPTPFSNDAGFLRAGIAAQTITVLPSNECADYVSALRRNPDLADAILLQQTRINAGQRIIPETWRVLNSPSDSHLRLTPRHYRITQRFAEALCR